MIWGSYNDSIWFTCYGFFSFWSLTQRQTFPVSIFCKILWVSSNSKMCDVTASVKIKRLVNRFIGSPPERSQIVHTFCRKGWELKGIGWSRGFHCCTCNFLLVFHAHCALWICTCCFQVFSDKSGFWCWPCGCVVAYNHVSDITQGDNNTHIA